MAGTGYNQKGSDLRYPSEGLLMNLYPIGLVNKIIPQSFVDGPGNRTAIFMQGCSMHCLFCHNPQTINFCSNCGDCVAVCPSGALRMSNSIVTWNDTICEDCSSCEKACIHYSSARVKAYTPAQLWEKVRPNLPFISGITVSGGEPTLHMPFLRDFFYLVKQESNLSTMIETNGNIPTDKWVELLPVLDQVMIDLKAFDTDIHKKLTGVGNQIVKETIRFLARYNKVYAVRMTVVPGYNDTINNAAQVAKFIAGIDAHIRLAFFRFRSHGTRGEAEHWSSPPDELLDTLVSAAAGQGLEYVERSI